LILLGTGAPSGKLAEVDLLMFDVPGELKVRNQGLGCRMSKPPVIHG